MIYDRELMRHKRTNFHHRKGLITFKRIGEKSIIDRIMQHIKFSTMGIHGMSHIWEKDASLKVRFFWISVVTAAIITCAIMYTMLSDQHIKMQIKTVVKTSQMPIYKINFPAVALCPWTNVNWSRYKAAEEKFLPHMNDIGIKKVFYDVLSILDDMDLSQMDILALMENRTVPPVIDTISLNDLVNFVAFRCDDVFVECIYDEMTYDCCKIFVPEYTEKGICMVFNSMVSEEAKKKQINDEFYPWKNRKAGEGTGLQFTVRYNKTFARNPSDANFGIDVMIKDCEEWSVSLINYFLPNRKSYLSITPTLSETSERIRYFKPHRRRCLFADERSKKYHHIEGLPFNKVNCITNCQQKNFIRICNCSLPWFFPTIDARDCTVSDFKCIYKNKDLLTYIKSPFQDDYVADFRKGVVCDCLNSCKKIDFSFNLYANKLSIPNLSYPIIQGDIYIGQGVLTKYETRLFNTLFDLIAQFGGILGLCLGASVLSVAEVLYAALKITILVLVTKCAQVRTVKTQTKKRFNKK